MQQHPEQISWKNAGTHKIQFLPLLLLFLFFPVLPFICTETHEIVSGSQSLWISAVRGQLSSETSLTGPGGFIPMWKERPYSHSFSSLKRQGAPKVRNGWCERERDRQTQLGSQGRTVLFQRVSVLCNVNKRARGILHNTQRSSVWLSFSSSLHLFSLSLSLTFCLLICHLKGKILSFSHFHVTSNLYDWLSSVEHKRRLTLFCSSTYLVCSWFLKLHKSTTKLVHVVFNFGSSKAKTYLCQEGKVFNY